MPKITPSDVVVEPGRFRASIDPGKLAELSASIQKLGLLQPIILEQNRILRAGYRRLLAVKALGWDEIEYKNFEDLDELTRREIEFDENDKREAFSWQERVKAVAEIHHLRQTNDQFWTAGDTAKRLNLSESKISEDLQLAQALEGAITPAAAARIEARETITGAKIAMKRELEAALVRELEKRSMAAQQAAAPTQPHGWVAAKHQTAQGRVYLGTAHIVLREMTSDSVQLIVTDPPWLIDFANTTMMAKFRAESYEDSEDAEEEVMHGLEEAYRVLSPTRHIYCFVSADNLVMWMNRLEGIGFRLRRRPLVWYKVGWANISDTYTRFMTNYDAILWGWKPGPQGECMRFINPVKEAYDLPRPDSWHPSAKPQELIEKWINASTNPDEIVLDPFCGSGSTLRAARHLGRRYIGVEKDATTFDGCVNELVLQETDDEPDGTKA